MAASLREGSAALRAMETSTANDCPLPESSGPKFPLVDDERNKQCPKKKGENRTDDNSGLGTYGKTTLLGFQRVLQSVELSRNDYGDRCPFA